MASPRAEEPLGEVEIVRLVLSSDAHRAQLDAASSRATADGRGAPIMSNPLLEARHEAGAGPAGATVDAVGASVGLDLGLSGWADAAASRHRRAAGSHTVRHIAIDQVCSVRQSVLDLWATQLDMQATRTAQQRLDSLVAALEELQMAGEGSRYDQQRAAVAAEVHRAALSRVVYAAERAQADFQVRTGMRIGLPVLSPLQEPSALSVEEAVAADPLVAALTAQVDAARQQLAAERRDALPDLSLFAGPRWDANGDGTGRAQGYEVGGSVELPLFDQNRRATAAAAADLAEAKASLAARTAEVSTNVTAAQTLLESLDDGSVVDGGSVWEGARARYVAGESSIEELLTVATDVEALSLAEIEREALRRRATLTVRCTTGALEPEFAELLEGLLR